MPAVDRRSVYARGPFFWRNATCSSWIKAESLSFYVVNTIAYYVEGYYGSFVIEENSTVTVFGAEGYSGLLNRSKYRSTRQKKSTMPPLSVRGIRFS